MAERPGLLKKESAAFANDKKPGSGPRRRGLGLGRSGATGVGPRKKDELLEHTLISNVSIAGLLTKREVEILRLIVSGKTNKEIAKAFCRTERTVEYHRNRLMRKLNTRNTADLVRCAIAMGIV